METGGSVRIDQNDSLISAEGLANLRIVNGGLSLWGNPQMQVVGLDDLEFVSEYLRIGYGAVNSVSAPSLETCCGETAARRTAARDLLPEKRRTR